jgi:ubiquinone/menaquinone biosynthesis C-methylase UbiE
MKLEQYSIYFEQNFDLIIEEKHGNRIKEGKLIPKGGVSEEITITDYIPRFVDRENYAKSFGFQWHKFRETQLDSYTGIPISEDRLFQGTKWSKEELKGKKILEAGSGAGRFTEILLKYGAEVVSFDFSQAVESNYENNGGNDTLFLFQGDIRDIPFDDNYFDYVLCYGVLQHTPSPEQSFEELYRVAKKEGKISIDYYLRPSSPTVWATPKYFWHKKTSNMDPERLLSIITFYIPVWLPIDTFIKNTFRHYGYSLLARIPIPCYNYLGLGLTHKQRKIWAILDTFDALSASYDIPKTVDEVKKMVGKDTSQTTEVYLGGNGVIANIIK